MAAPEARRPFSSIRPAALAMAGWFLFLCVFPVQVTAAAPKRKDPVESEKASIVLGRKNWKEWRAETDWDSYAAEGYKLNKGRVSAIARLAKAKKAAFLVFAGSWCKDSEAQVPIVMKLLGAAQVPARGIEVYGVDANLKEPSGMAQKHEVTNTPTLIILSGQTELGRIVVRPASTWEDEIRDILSR